MQTLFDKELLTIQAGQVVSGIAPCNRILRVTRGRVWLTVEGLPEDYWLDAGQTFRLYPGPLVVIEADRQASIEMLSENGARQVGRDKPAESFRVSAASSA